MGAAGLLLLVAAIEVLFAHQVSLEPEKDDNGELTLRGEARFRQDVIVGVTFFLTGGALVGVAMGGLIDPKPVCEVDDEGISLRIAGPRTAVTLGWADVAEIRSGREPDDGEPTRPLLLVMLRYPDLWPEEYWGARRDGSWLIVDAGSWNVAPEEVAVHARLAMASFGRDAAAGAAEDEGSPADTVT